MVSVIGENIKKIRLEKDISAYELAKRAGVGGATISQIESGKRATLKGDTMEKVAHALGVTVSELLGDDETLSFETNDMTDILNIINYADGLTLDGIELSKTEMQLINISIASLLNSIRYTRLR